MKTFASLASRAFVLVVAGAAAADAWYIQGPRWTDDDTVMSLNMGAWNNPVIDAMFRWNNIGACDFSVTYNLENADHCDRGTLCIDPGGNAIEFENFADGVCDDDPSGALAVTRKNWTPFGFYCNADILFNTAYSWTMNCRPWTTDSPYELNTVAIHELGHALGLEHENRWIATMNCIYHANCTGVHADDRDGARTLYGSGGTYVDLTLTNWVKDDESCETAARLVRGPLFAAAGQQVGIETAMENMSNVPLTFNIRWYLSTDNNITTADRVLGTNTNASLEAGWPLAFTRILTIPADVATGNYFFGAIVDYDHRVAEADEGNNALAHPVPCFIGGITPTPTVTATATPAPPPNDRCFAAQAVQVGTYAFTTLGAGTDGPATACGQIEGDVWFTIVAPCDGQLSANLCNADFDTMVAAYADPCPAAANSELACNDDFCDRQSRLVFDVDLGATYTIRIGGYQTARGSGAVTFSCANSNDDCIFPQPVDDGSTTLFDTTTATTDGPGQSCFSPQKDLWFCYRAPCTGNVTIDTCGSSFDTVLEVFEVCRCPLGAPNIACENDGGGCGTGSSVTFQTRANREYIVRVGGYNGAFGSGVLNVHSCDGVVPTVTPTPRPGECVLITNPSFESPERPQPGVLLSAGSSISGWTVVSGNVRQVSNWPCDQGFQCIELNGTVPGTIETQFPTTPGGFYDLRYAVSGDPTVPGEKTVRIYWDGELFDAATFDTTGYTEQNLQWLTYTFFGLWASGEVTSLRFESMTDGAAGPAVDHVCVTPVDAIAPVPWGDLNGDNVPGALDAALLLQWDAFLIDRFPAVPALAWPYYPPRADVSGDTALGTVDAAQLLQFDAFLRNCFGADPDCDGLWPN